MPNDRRPGDLFLDRYLGTADLETRERASEAFRKYALVLLRIGDRLVKDQGIDDSTEMAGRLKLSSTPTV